jgi:hypothetical protein
MQAMAWITPGMIKWLAQAAQATPGSGSMQHSANTQHGPYLSPCLERKETRRAMGAAAWAGLLLLLLVVVVLLLLQQGPQAEQQGVKQHCSEA